jgi:ferritin-like metal-binding protein YciE
MTKEQQKDYLAWLNDAHAMERGLVTVLEKQVKETEDFPDMQQRIEQHLEETKRHATMVETAIKRNSGSVSGMKDFMSQTTAAVQGLGMSMMGDAMVKNVHSSYAAEHFEIATYTLLQAAAQEMGDDQTVVMCDQILQDEVNMANWLIEQIPEVTKMHMRERELVEA